MAQPESDLPIELAAPARRALIGAGYWRLDQLTMMSEAEVKQLHGIGPNALKQLRRALDARGLSFADRHKVPPADRKDMKRSERFEPKSDEKMSADAVIQLLQLFEQHGIEVVVDGGWGVDALLGEQTRFHADLDIALEHKDVPKLRALLEARGYKDVPRDDTRDCNFVMGDEQGHEVDFHSYTFDAHGTLVFGVEYPFGSLTGTGVIQGYSVKCISAEWMVKFHSGYELDENDYHDVSALCERFGMALPAEYEKFTRESAE